MAIYYKCEIITTVPLSFNYVWLPLNNNLTIVPQRSTIVKSPLRAFFIALVSFYD